jgi:zinc ribbon protein
MHCPTCGAETSLEQRFCRSCGMDLETVSKLVAAHSSPETLKLEKSLTKKAAQKRMYQSFKWGMICFILGSAALATTKTLSLDKIFNLGPLFLLFIGMGIMVYGVLSSMGALASKSMKVLDPASTVELHEAEATNELPPARVPVSVPSITERTTQLIATEDAAKSRDKLAR